MEDNVYLNLSERNFTIQNGRSEMLIDVLSYFSIVSLQYMLSCPKRRIAEYKMGDLSMIEIQRYMQMGMKMPVKVFQTKKVRALPSTGA